MNLIKNTVKLIGTCKWVTSSASLPRLVALCSGFPASLFYRGGNLVPTVNKANKTNIHANNKQTTSCCLFSDCRETTESLHLPQHCSLLFSFAVCSMAFNLLCGSTLPVCSIFQPGSLLTGNHLTARFSPCRLCTSLQSPFHNFNQF